MSAPRKLAAILAADVAGYSRLTGLDEEGTHVQLQDHLRLLVDPKIAVLGRLNAVWSGRGAWDRSPVGARTSRTSTETKSWRS